MTISLWWGFVTSVKYISAVHKNRSKFRGTTTMPCFCCPTKKLRNFPFESFIKVIFLGVHTIIEICTGLHYRTDHLAIENENLHHVAMLSAFFVGAIIEILIYYGWPFPKRTEYAFQFIAFLIQFILMSGHLNGDIGLEKVKTSLNLNLNPYVIISVF